MSQESTQGGESTPQSLQVSTRQTRVETEGILQRFVRLGDATVHNGPTLGDGRVCVRSSPDGGEAGRGLFAGSCPLERGTQILYSGELITGDEAARRKESGEASYVLQIGYRSDSHRVDGHIFA